MAFLFDLADLATIIDVVAHIGDTDVRAFSLNWEDCKQPFPNSAFQHKSASSRGNFQLVLPYLQQPVRYRDYASHYLWRKVECLSFSVSGFCFRTKPIFMPWQPISKEALETLGLLMRAPQTVIRSAETALAKGWSDDQED